MNNIIVLKTMNEMEDVMMKNKRKYLFIILIIIILVILGIFYSYVIKNGTEDVILLKSDSYFDEFYKKGDKVYIKCQISIQNNSNKDKYINLLADMKEDVDNGLLKNPMVLGYNKKGNNDFFIPRNSKKEYTVIFIGDFAGKQEKQNRNLPSIELKVIKTGLKAKTTG